MEDKEKIDRQGEGERPPRTLDERRRMEDHYRDPLLPHTLTQTTTTTTTTTTKTTTTTTTTTTIEPPEPLMTTTTPAAATCGGGAGAAAAAAAAVSVPLCLSDLSPHTFSLFSSYVSDWTQGREEQQQEEGEPAGPLLLPHVQSRLAELGLQVRVECGHLSYKQNKKKHFLLATRKNPFSSTPFSLTLDDDDNNKLPSSLQSLLPPHSRCFFVRHGETPGNVKGLFQGRSDERPVNWLNQKGREQAHIAALKILQIILSDESITTTTSTITTTTTTTTKSSSLARTSNGTAFIQLQHPLRRRRRRLFIFSSPSARALQTAQTFVQLLLDDDDDDDITTTRFPPLSSQPSTRMTETTNDDDNNTTTVSSPLFSSFSFSCDAACCSFSCGAACYHQAILPLPELQECGFGVLENQGGYLADVGDQDYRRLYLANNALVKPVGVIARGIVTELQRQGKHILASPQQPPVSESFVEVILRAKLAIDHISKQIIQPTDNDDDDDNDHDDSRPLILLFGHSLIGHALRILFRKPIPPTTPSSSPDSTRLQSPTWSHSTADFSIYSSNDDDQRIPSPCAADVIHRFAGDHKLPNATPFELWNLP